MMNKKANIPQVATGIPLATEVEAQYIEAIVRQLPTQLPSDMLDLEILVKDGVTDYDQVASCRSRR